MDEQKGVKYLFAVYVVFVLTVGWTVIFLCGCKGIFELPLAPLTKGVEDGMRDHHRAK